MFKKSIAATPLTTDTANDYFQNIRGNKFGQDNSFLATLRALVAPRIKDGEHIYLSFTSSSYDANTISSVPADRVIRAICSDMLSESEGNLVVHSFTSTQENNLANMRLIETKFTSCYPGYYRLEKVRDFYRKSFAVDCYINAEQKNVAVFVDNLDTKKLHYLQVSILAFLPWYFNPDDGVSELEMQLLYSLRETSSENYEKCIMEIAAQYDFRTARIRKLLRGFETRYEQIECDKMRNEIQRCDVEIDRLNSSIGMQLGKRNDFCIKLLGLERKIAEGSEESEIMDYFLCNSKLYLENVTNNDMYFCVKDYLEYFDPEMAERTINNSRSFVYPNGTESHRGITPADMKMLMTEIFLSDTPRLRIKFCAAYRFDLNGSVGAMRGHEFPMEYADCMPNTHINSYSCMGNYQTTINNLLKRRNYIGALEQCIASCKSLNFGDSTVMREFMGTMYGDNSANNRCIELPDGSVVRPVEAIKWLKQQQVNNNEQETEEA